MMKVTKDLKYLNRVYFAPFRVVVCVCGETLTQKHFLSFAEGKRTTRKNLEADTAFTMCEKCKRTYFAILPRQIIKKDKPEDTPI